MTRIYNLLMALAEFGYVDGQNILFEFRFANHALERLPALAAELVAGQPDVIYTWTSGGARAAAAATSTIPIVVAPVNEGTMAALVPDFAHPAGNITGMTLTSRQQHEKCLQLLKEAAPGITRVGVLLNPLNPVWQTYPEVLAEAAQALVSLWFGWRRAARQSSIRHSRRWPLERVDGLFGISDSTLVGNTPTLKRIVELIAEYRLPSVSDETDFAERAGSCRSGRISRAIGRGAAEYIHRILQGAKVGRAAGRAALQVPADRQPEDRAALGITHSALDSAARRRGDRVSLAVRRDREGSRLGPKGRARAAGCFASTWPCWWHWLPAC